MRNFRGALPSSSFAPLSSWVEQRGRFGSDRVGSGWELCQVGLGLVGLMVVGSDGRTQQSNLMVAFVNDASSRVEEAEGRRSFLRRCVE